MERVIKFVLKELHQLNMTLNFDFLSCFAPPSSGTSGVRSHEAVTGQGNTWEPWIHRKCVTISSLNLVTE